MQKAYHEAEEAMLVRDYALARDRYRHVLQLGRDDEELMSEDLFLDMNIRLAKAMSKMGEVERAERVLSHLLTKNPPRHFLQEIQLLRVEGFRHRKQLEKAYEILADLHKEVDMYLWKGEYRLLYLELKNRAEKRYEKSLAKAEALFQAKQYSKAIDLHKQVLFAIQQGTYLTDTQDAGRRFNLRSKIQYRLAQAYFALGEYEHTIKVLDLQKPSLLDTPRLKDFYVNGLYLQGLAYKYLGNYAEAAKALTEYAKLLEQKEVSTLLTLHRELADCFLVLKEPNKAKAHLNAYLDHETNLKLRVRAQLDLARTLIELKQLSEAEDIFAWILTEQEYTQIQEYELSYLQGESAQQQKQHHKAIRFFEKSIPQTRGDRAAWFNSAMIKQAESYVALARESKNKQELQEGYFIKASFALEKILEQNNDDHVRLALARVYESKLETLHDFACIEKVENLIGKSQSFHSISAKAEALLIQAKTAQRYSKKKAFFIELTSDVYSKTPTYGEGFFHMALADLNESKQLMAEGKQPEAYLLLEQADDSFHQAFQLLDHRSQNLEAASALEYLAETYWLMNTDASRAQALETLQRLLEQHSTLLDQTPQGEKVQVLLGELSWKNYIKTNQYQYLKTAENTFLQLLENSTNTNLLASTLHHLGSIAYHKKDYDLAEKYFVEQSQKAPRHPLTASAYHWAARAAEEQGLDEEHIRKYRTALYKNFPQSKYAAEAMFRVYPQEAYLAKDLAAMIHLRELPKQYPESPLSLLAYFLLGMEKEADRRGADGSLLQGKDLWLAIEQYEKLEAGFKNLAKKSQIPEQELARYKRLFENSRKNRAQCYLKLAEESEGPQKEIVLQKAKEILSNTL